MNRCEVGDPHNDTPPMIESYRKAICDARFWTLGAPCNSAHNGIVPEVVGSESQRAKNAPVFGLPKPAAFHPPTSNPGSDAPAPQDASGPDAVLPPPIHATPGDVKPIPGEAITWWQPGWRDVRVFVGWRWVFLSPVIIVVLLAAGGVFWAPLRGPFFMLGAELLVLVIAVALSLAGYVIQRAVKARREPFCIYCGYNLTGLPDDYRCPECGRPYTWRLIAEYRKDSQWFITRWKLYGQQPPAQGVFPAGPTPRKRRSRDGTE